MAYTNFGKLLRKEMIEKDENLVDIAKLLKVSTSFVSSVLTGKKSIPDSWIDLLSTHYNFSTLKYQEFNNAYIEEKKNIRIDIENNSYLQKNLAIEFQRKLPELEVDTIQHILDILKDVD